MPTFDGGDDLVGICGPGEGLRSIVVLDEKAVDRGLEVGGDTAGVETLRRILTDWLTDIVLIAAGHRALLGSYIGYYRPYATSHDDLDRDAAMREELKVATRSLLAAVRMLRRGALKQPDAGEREPRPK